MEVGKRRPFYPVLRGSAATCAWLSTAQGRKDDRHHHGPTSSLHGPFASLEGEISKFDRDLRPTRLLSYCGLVVVSHGRRTASCRRRRYNRLPNYARKLPGRPLRRTATGARGGPHRLARL